MKALFFKHTRVLAGGEKYSLFLARVLRDLGFDVCFLSNFAPLREQAIRDGHTAAWYGAGPEITALRTQMLFIICAPIYFILGVYRLVVCIRPGNSKKGAVFFSSLNEKFLLTVPARLLGYRVYWVEVLNIGSGMIDGFLTRILKRLHWGSVSAGGGKSILIVLYRFFAKYTTCIIAASESVTVELKSFLSDIKIKTIYHAIDGADISGRKVNQSNRCVITSVARLHREKGIDVLIIAFSKLRALLPDTELQLLLIGDGEDKERLMSLVDELKVGGAVQFLGYQADVYTYLRQTDVFVLPSVVRESFGISILEAMASGCAVVASRIGGIPEIIRDGENGYLAEPGDVEELLHKIYALATSYDLRERFVAEGYRSLETKFSYKASLKRMEEIV